MKMEFGPYVKTLSPATATVDIKITELEDDERFDVETLKMAVTYILSQHQPLYDIMEFDNHQTFYGVFNFEFNGQVKSMKVFPLFTKNFGKRRQA